MRDATKPASECSQGSGKPEEGKEDCLYLNAFMQAPALHAPSQPKPVVVIIHGGGFAVGGAAQYWNTTRHTGLVVFAIQYRLGVLGFFSMQAPPQNVGMQDQQLAFFWVQKNAASFGGDASRVMIHGCSAGGASVAGHLVLQRSFGLYSSASLASPGGHTGWMGDEKRINDDWLSPALSRRHSQQLLEHFRCSRALANSSIECLQNVTLGELLSFAKSLRFAPALPVEGDYPLGLIQRGHWNQVPTMIGGASCESCYEALQYVKPGPSWHITKEEFNEGLIKYGLSGVNGSGIGPATLEKWYEGRIAAEGRWRTFARILGDSGHSCSTALHAEAFAKSSRQNNSIWRYFFDVRTTPLPGAVHCSEEAWLTHEHTPSSQTEQRLEDALSSFWAGLAAHGDPNAGSSKAPLSWSRFSANSSDTLIVASPAMVMNSTVDTIRSECSNWKPYLGWGKEHGAGSPVEAVEVMV